MLFLTPVWLQRDTQGSSDWLSQGGSGGIAARAARWAPPLLDAAVSQLGPLPGTSAGVMGNVHLHSAQFLRLGLGAAAAKGSWGRARANPSVSVLQVLGQAPLNLGVK